MSWLGLPVNVCVCVCVCDTCIGIQCAVHVLWTFVVCMSVCVRTVVTQFAESMRRGKATGDITQTELQLICNPSCLSPLTTKWPRSYHALVS